jgi:hypothetical protein
MKTFCNKCALDFTNGFSLDALHGTCIKCKCVADLFRKRRFYLNPLVDHIILLKLELNAIPRIKCSNPGCTSKGKFFCPCLESEHYCSNACRKAHWPQHSKGCWFSERLEVQSTITEKDSMTPLTRFLAEVVFPAMRKRVPQH